MLEPTIGRIVIYRSRTGEYDVPAIVTATEATLSPKGVESGNVPALSDLMNVHLTVFTPGKPGLREGAQDFQVESPHGRSENVAGCYQEWDIPWAGAEEPFAAGTWHWPAWADENALVPVEAPADISRVEALTQAVWKLMQAADVEKDAQIPPYSEAKEGDVTYARAVAEAMIAGWDALRQ